MMLRKALKAAQQSFITTRTPSSSTLWKLCRLMDSIAPYDLGLDEQTHCLLPSFRENNSEQIRCEPSSPSVGGHSPKGIACYPIYECPEFTAAIFMLEKGSTIPLHDHPGMTVVSKLVYGEIAVRAFDPIGNAPVGLFGRLSVDDRIKANSGVDRNKPSQQCDEEFPFAVSSSCRVFYPNRANLHEFTALSNSAILDILAPSYDPVSRPCTYFRELDEDEIQRHNLALHKPDPDASVLAEYEPSLVIPSIPNLIFQKFVGPL